jgi:hypothetical protein
MIFRYSCNRILDMLVIMISVSLVESADFFL